MCLPNPQNSLTVPKPQAFLASGRALPPPREAPVTQAVLACGAFSCLTAFTQTALCPDILPPFLADSPQSSDLIAHIDPQGSPPPTHLGSRITALTLACNRPSQQGSYLFTVR